MAVSLLPVASEAQTTQTWLNNGISNEWSLFETNWDAGVPWTNGNDASFGGTAEAVDVSTDITVNSILFNTGGWTISDTNNNGTFTLVGQGRITTSGVFGTLGATINESIEGGNLVKAGDSILVLTAANSYTGSTTVEKGTLQLNNGGALGSTTGVTVSSGGSVGLNGVTVSGVSITLNGGGSGDNFGALKATSAGTSVWAGNVILGSGSTRVGAAVATSVLEISGVISGSQALNIRTNDGGGVVLLSNAGNTYSGDTNIIGGILKVGVTNALPTGTKVVLGNNTGSQTATATLDLNGFDQRVAGVTAAAGNNVVAKVTNTSATAAVLTVDFAGTSSTDNAFIAGNLSLVKAGTGTFILQSANTYTGPTTVEAGILQINNAGALGGTSGVTVNNGATLALENVTVSGVSITISGSGVGGSFGALRASGAGKSVWTGNVTIGSGTRLGAVQTSSVLEIAGAIDSGGVAHGLLIRGENNGGTVLLSNANNTYLGNTTIIGGKLQVGVDDALPTGTIVFFGNTSTQGKAILDLNGFDQRVAGISSVSGNNNEEAKVTNDSVTAAVLTVDYSGGTALATGNTFIAGNLSLVKEGTGTFQITSSSSHTGTTTVNAGTLVIAGQDSHTGDTVVNGGALSITGQDSHTGDTVVNGGTLSITGQDSHTGDTVVNGGTLEISGVLGAVTTSGMEFILNGGTFRISNSTTGTNNNNRLSDTATITFRDGDLTFTGSVDAGTNSSETVGSLALDRGYQTVTITNNNINNVSTLTASGFTRGAGGGVVFLTGTNLGADFTDTTNVSRFFVTNGPTLIGTTDALNTGVNSAVKNTKIVPYLVGSSTGSTTPDTFVTYNSQTGFRPLDPNSEFTQNSFVSGHNTRVTATATTTLTMSTTTAINSLILSSTAGTNTLSIAANQVLTVSSGAILFATGTNTIAGATGTTQGTLNFGTQEGIIYASSTSNSTIGARITGSAGLTVGGNGTLVLTSGGSNYAGDTTLLSGVTAVSTNSTVSGGNVTQGPLGTGNLVFAGGAIRTTQGGASVVTRTIHNNIIFKADTTLASGGDANGRLAFAGNVTLTEGDRVLTNNALNTTTFSGAIGEDGQKRGITVTTVTANTGAVIFTGTNTYTGDTKVAGLATLMVNGTHNTGSSYHVASGATLTGGGTIGVAAGGNVTIAAGGTLSVGDGNITNTAVDLAITTTAGGSLVFADSTSILKLDLISDASSGTGSDMSGDASRADRLVVSGNTNLNGARLILGTASGLLATTFSEGDRWKIFDWVDALPTGAFTIAQPDLPVLAAGLGWDFSELYTQGTITVMAVPEPSRAVLLMGGVVAGLLRRRRRN